MAIKLVRAEVNSAFVVARFRHERQILAALDHPNIARLPDGGATADGRPFFVMEYVEGEPIDVYCERRALSVSERIRLFLDVCSAVQYAHRHLFVHRDLKPGNILVSTENVPKLLDFGIAKLMASDQAAPPSDMTATAARPMTSEYASPEQIRGEPVSTASDVYALGMILDRLLTGRRPYKAQSRIAGEWERAVCEEEPLRPSDAVLRGLPDNPASGPQPASFAAESTPGRLRKRLHGDLDKIILTALRKEPARRYASVEQFAEDLRRHLAHQPVRA